MLQLPYCHLLFTTCKLLKCRLQSKAKKFHFSSHTHVLFSEWASTITFTDRYLPRRIWRAGLFFYNRKKKGSYRYIFILSTNEICPRYICRPFYLKCKDFYKTFIMLTNVLLMSNHIFSNANLKKCIK